MSTCTAVRTALPAIAAGEPDEVGARGHLLACPACRAEHDTLARDLGRIRAGLAQVDVRPAGAVERIRRGLAREGRRGGSRVLSWWTVGVGLAAVVIVGFLAGRALRDEPDGPPPGAQAAGKGPWSHFRDVTDVVTRADAPRVVQFRIEADGETRLRWRVRGPDSDWEERGPWSLTLAEPEAAYAALRNLKEALLEASPERLVGAEARSEKSPRVVLDADPGAPWRFVQWVLAVASAHPNDLGRLTFLFDDAAASVDIDLPMDPTPETFSQVQELGSVKLFRKEDPSEPKRAWTRIRWLQERTWDLPGGAPEVEAGMFAELENTIVAAIKQAAPVDPVAIEIKAPPPTGGLVPTGDVLRVVTTLRRAGVATILLEGAPPPSGHGWNLFPQRK